MLVSPSPDLEYPVEARWRGDTHILRLVFLPRLCAVAKANRTRVDLDRGEWVYSDGTRQDMLGARTAFETMTRLQAPPWLFRLPKPPRGFALARGRLALDLLGDRVTIELPEHCTPIFACYEGEQAESPALDATPLSEWTHVDMHLSSSVIVRAATWSDAQAVRKTLDEIVGTGFALQRPGVADDIVVLASPAGVHFSALPELAELRPKLKRLDCSPDEHGVSVDTHTMLSAATIKLPKKRYVCASIDDRTGLEHEIYHLLEVEVLTPVERKWLNADHARTVERGGPFARPYGYLRREFLPTLGELRHTEWLSREHPELVAWLDALRTRVRASAAAR